MTRIDDQTPKGSHPASDRGLRAFCQAAREGSLTAAARSLEVGQPALSHAISRLEQSLDADLLIRSSRGVSLTPTGQELFDAVDPAFRLIDTAVAEARYRGDVETVSLSVSTSLASWWLLPRLPDFKRQHPDVDLRIVATETDAGVDTSSVDLWIPLGLIERPGMTATPLVAEALLPVATPELAERIATTAPGDLLQAPLLHLEEHYAPRYDWHRWFRDHGVEAPVRLPGDRSNDYSLVIQAALEGQGVALGWHHIVSDLITAGRLVTLAPPVETEQPFVILTSTTRTRRPGAMALRQWLIDTMAHNG